MSSETNPALFALRIPPPRMIRRLVGAGAIVGVILVWWVATAGAGAENRWISPVILPSPAEVIRSFPSLLNERALLESIAATLKRVLIGFGLAGLVGVPLGIAAGSWRVIEATGAPLALFGRNLPVAALIPLTILWFGIDETQKIMFIFIACVAFVYIMLAELINAGYGLGYLLMTSQRRGLSEHIILILMVIGLLAFTIDR